MVIDGSSGHPDAGDGPPERGHSAEPAARNVLTRGAPHRQISNATRDRLDAVLVIGDNYNIDGRPTG
jgi:hypothetical protein